jgi:hypothetical protein
MKQKNKMMKKSLLLILFVIGFAQVGNSQVNIAVDTGMNWVGYMNVFDSVGANYIFGQGWGVPDLKTVVDPGNGSMQLKPNYNNYNATDPFWSNGALGNKFCEANTYIEDVALLGQTVNFDGFVDTFDINAGYTVHAFIKVLDANNGFATVLWDYDTISATGTFSTSLVIPNTSGFIPQYGFTVMGLNANPVDEAAYGKVHIRGNQAPSMPMVNTTFQVQSPDSLPVYLFGSWSGWSNFPGDPMTSIGNNTYEATISLTSGQTYEYLHVNGSVTEDMDSTAACTNMNAMFTNRILTIGNNDSTVCNIWETCNTCIPVSVDDVLKDNLEVLVSNQFIRLNASELNAVDGLEIFDIVGKSVYSSNGSVLTNRNINVNLESNALYIIRVNQGDSYYTIKSMITK